MQFSNQPRRVAVIGSGISGLSAAWLLSRTHQVTLYEAAPRLGGHTRTIDVAGVGPVDMGFIVFNEQTYPNLVALLRHLGVGSHATDMSFGVSRDGGRFEYAGSDLAGLLAQPANLLRPRFWRMLHDLIRFYRAAPAAAAGLERDLTSLDDFLKAGRFNPAFIEDHLLPMAAAIWSTPAERVGAYPAAAFIRFCANHGLLRLRDRPLWRTVEGGSSAYIAPLIADAPMHIRTGSPVVAITRGPRGVAIRCADRSVAAHDEVVIATHAPQALAMLEDPSDAEISLLGALRTERHHVVMHTDRRLMPRRRAAWSSWNYLEPKEGGLTVSYWMNRLQHLPGSRQIFVTLNPPFEPEGIIHKEFFAHPQFDAAAMRAQKALWSLQGTQRTWYCGAWFGAGFHEDGLQAGLAVAEQLGGKRRPWEVENESGRIHQPLVAA